MTRIIIDGRSYRSVSLESDPLVEDEQDSQAERLMRRRPTPAFERLGVHTRNGNFVKPVAR